MNADVTNNWLTNAKLQASCGGLTDFELKSLEIGNAYELLVAKDSSVIPPLSGNVTLLSLYNKLICGDLLSETEYHWALAEISRIEKLQVEAVDAQSEAAIETASHYILKAGIHTWNDGAATAGDIPITGLLSTDIVNVTLHSQTGAELVTKAVAAAGQINVTLSANGTDTTTKLNYSALRAMPAS